MMMASLVACVRPIEPTPTPAPPTPTPSLTPTPPPTPEPNQEPTFPSEIVSTWLAQNLGAVANNLTLFTQYQIAGDDIIGYTFQDASGLLCAGFAQATAATLTVWNADYRCNDPAAQLIVGSLPFALTNGEFYAATYGLVNPAALPNAGGVALEFPDGGNATQFIGDTDGGFILLRAGLTAPNRIVISDANGNLITQVPIQ